MKISINYVLAACVLLSVFMVTAFLIIFLRGLKDNHELAVSVAYIRASEQYRKDKKLALAVEYGKKAVDAYPRGFGHLYLGIAYTENGNYVDAVSELRIANTIMETNEGNFYLAKSLLALGNIEEAKMYLHKVENQNDTKLAAESQRIRISLH